MLEKEKFNKLYSEVAEGLSHTLKQLQGLRVEHEESKQHVIGMMDKLESIQKTFSDEIAMLEDNAEWDKFTIAFFGETNAGKSTIIESLRIMFDEEARKTTIAQNQNQLGQLEVAVADQSEQLKRVFTDAFGALAQELLALQRDVTLFKRFMDAEKSKREAVEAANQALQKDVVESKQSIEAEKSKREAVEADNLALRKQGKQLKAVCITTSSLAVAALGVIVWLAGGA
ncbi:hypothetical protein [Marinobacter nauticus]|uniref:Uncharacterized protein n=1 Tax=Marinobacter nauticus TaxID=2743 RepID=A0A1M2UYB9_MARNT|nr:hypothetical protein [Marinobacter nauticus]OJT00354.1 hypothetical protein BEE62_09860 [Marinobacter nauticus]